MALAMARPWKHPDTGIYWLRRAVPADLRTLVGKREEKLSLKTRDPTEARRLHSKAMAEVEARWESLRAPVRKLEIDELQALVTLTYERCVEAGGPPGIDWDPSLSEDLWTDHFDLADPFKMEMDKYIHRDWCRRAAEEYLTSRGLKVNEDDRLKVAKAIGHAVGMAVAVLRRRAQGDFGAQPTFGTPQGVPFQAATASRPPGKKVTLQSLLDGWAAEKSPVAKTLYSWQKILDQLKGFIGHDDAAQLTPDDMLKWKAALVEQGLKTKTIRDSKIAPMRAILQWGVDNRKIAANPASRIVIDIRGKLADRVRGYSEDEAKLILQRSAAETDPVRRWIPLLCAYSGARISEVCQIRREDLVNENGIWCIRFVPEAGSLKNVNSERIVPLHPAIIHAGFLDFARKTKAGAVFSMLELDRFQSRGGTGTKLIAKWVRSLGVTDERISPSHSWRHRFKTLGRRHELMPDIVNAITGHHRKTVADAYGEFPIEALYRELRKIPTVER